MTPLEPSAHLTPEQKQEFFRDGFIVIKNAVPREISQQARDLISSSLPKDERKLVVPAELATHHDVLRLFRDSRLAEIMRNEMGRYPDVISCQVAVTPPFDQLGGRPGTHIDGSWSGAIPRRAEEIEPIRGRPKDSAKYFGESDDLRGTNDGQLWQDPGRRISIGSYTALVGVCLNDQTKAGGGQFAVMKGLHEEVEAAFRRQRDAGGVIGPEGPEWPRIKTSAEGGTYFNGLPDSVREKAMAAAPSAQPIDGWPWPELTPLLLDQGDAVIALHSLPHTATPNLGPNPRMNVYFRIRRWRDENPHEGSRRLGHGVSDHLDRGYYGQFLDYPANYDPWKTSVYKLCNHWSEWAGMREVVANAGRSFEDPEA